MGEHDEFIADFLEECDENLDQLDQELVALEENPRDEDKLRSIFRNIHTIKGSSGFFGFSKIGALAHEGEAILGKLRDGELLFNPEIASCLLKTSDAIREILVNIEQTSTEGDKDYTAVHEALTAIIALTDDENPDPTPAIKSRDGGLDSLTQPDRGISQEGSVEPSEDIDALKASQQAKLPERNSHTDADESKTENQQFDPADRSCEAPHELSKEAQDRVKEISNKSQSVEQQDEVVPKVNQPTTIRVDVNLLDELMDFAGELVLARNSLNRCSEERWDSDLSLVATRVSQITSEIQDRVTRTRMQPIGGMWNRFQRVVRDLAVDCRKQVSLELKGEDTELDRSLLEAIKDPITHLLRNCIDHGIELPEHRVSSGKNPVGTVRLNAHHESGQVVIEVADDGAGIDVEKVRARAISNQLVTGEAAEKASIPEILQFIFEPGFSTTEKVSAISGRGVGMDVVRSHVERIGGSVVLDSTVGVGTRFTIRLPLTLAIVPALVVRSAEQFFVVPQASFSEVVKISSATPVEWVQQLPVYRLRDRLLPLIWLDELMGLRSPRTRHTDRDEVNQNDTRMQVAVLQVDQMQFGLVIDEVVRSQEIVVKPIGASVKAIGAFSAATILGDGTVALILDVSGIARLARLDPEAHGRGLEDKAVADGHANTKEASSKGVFGYSVEDVNERSLLLCESATGADFAIQMDAIERLEEISSEKLQYFESQTVLNYRGQVLPVTGWQRDGYSTSTLSMVDEASAQPRVRSLVVCNHSGSSFGILVRQIKEVVTVAEVTNSSESETDSEVVRDGAKRFAIVKGRVVEVLDLERELRLTQGAVG